MRGCDGIKDYDLLESVVDLHSGKQAYTVEQVKPYGLRVKDSPTLLNKALTLKQFQKQQAKKQGGKGT